MCTREAAHLLDIRCVGSILQSSNRPMDFSVIMITGMPPPHADAAAGAYFIASRDNNLSIVLYKACVIEIKSTYIPGLYYEQTVLRVRCKYRVKRGRRCHMAYIFFLNASVFSNLLLQYG